MYYMKGQLRIISKSILGNIKSNLQYYKENII